MITVQTIAAWSLATLLSLITLYSWFLLATQRFKPSMMLPCKDDGCARLAKKLFLLQSLLLAFAAGLVLMRITQLIQNHQDNVIDNLIVGLSSLFLIRGIGDFKYFGIFRQEEAGNFSLIDRKWITPLALFFFVLSVILLI